MKLNKQIEKNILDHYKRDEVKKRVIGHYNASELGTCYREWFWRYTNPLEINDETQMIFNMGHMYHSFVDEVLEKSKNIEVIHNEKSLLLLDNKSDCVVHGRVDNVVNYNDTEYILDTKSTKSVEWAEKFPTSEDYLMQLNIYMKFFNIKKGALLYIEKATLKTYLKELNYDKKYLDMALQRIGVIDKHLKENKLPIAEGSLDSKKSWKCRFCVYKDDCDKIEVKENGLKLK